MTTFLLTAPSASAAGKCTEIPQQPVSAGDLELSKMGRPLLASEWRDYKSRFVSPDGRVVDTANGGISHSEGQGYGMLLAALLDDADGFDRIWNWTRTHLLVRADGLAAWKWDPAHNRIADDNNATDGDLLIAWALGEAAERFSRPDYEEAGRALATAIGKTLVRQTKVGPVLLPGASGFEPEGPSGPPVLNLSYWIYPAFPVLERLAGGTDWQGIEKSGLALLQASRFGSRQLPSEWIRLAADGPHPATGRPVQFGYNAIRIPLYLLAAQQRLTDGLQAFAEQAGSKPIGVVDIQSGATVEVMGGNGFQLILALARCECSQKQIGNISKASHDELYYPATLGLLAKWFLIERYPQCL